jgi:hypothetical protein
LLNENLLYNIFYVFLDPKYNYLEKSQLSVSKFIEFGEESSPCNCYQYHDTEQGLIFFDIADISGTKFCVEYLRANSNFQGRMVSYETNFDVPKLNIPQPPVSNIFITEYFSKVTASTSESIISGLPANLKMVYKFSEDRVETSKTVYKNNNDFLYVINNNTYYYYKYDTTDNKWDEYVKESGMTEWNLTEKTDMSANSLLETSPLVDIFWTFGGPSIEQYKETSKFDSIETIKTPDRSFTCKKYRYYNSQTFAEKFFWITVIEGVEYCLNFTYYQYLTFQIEGYQTTGVQLPAGLVLPGGTGEDPGGTGEDPAALLTAEEIIDGLADSLQFCFKTTRSGVGGEPWSIETRGYKIDKNFLFEYKNVEGDYNYHYYKYNSAENNWDEYFLHAYDDEWASHATDFDAHALITDVDFSYSEIKEGIHKMLWKCKDPNSYREEYTSITSESKEMSGTTYDCNKYYYYENSHDQEITETFYLTTINGVNHCIYFTDGGDIFEVSEYVTTGVTFPETHVPLP